MLAIASAKASISASVRGLSENCLLSELSVVMIRLPANARLPFEALGTRALSVCRFTVTSPELEFHCLFLALARGAATQAWLLLRPR
jgi:hypothetical protein